MKTLNIAHAPAVAESDWMPFPGGELEGTRPKALCQGCRSRADEAAAGPILGRPALCFQCYRTELDRARRIKAAADLDTASEARFQSCLPFAPVNSARLTVLKAERAGARAVARVGSGAFVEKRCRAQIEARHALARVFRGLRERQMLARRADEYSVDAATHAAELQLPESWLPFVVAQ